MRKRETSRRYFPTTFQLSDRPWMVSCQSISLKLLVSNFEVSITSTSFGATVITVQGSDIICFLSFAPFTPYTMEKIVNPERSLFTIAAPLVSFPTDFKGTTSHDVFAVPTHHLYSATPLSRSSNSFQPDIKCSSVHLNRTGEISWFLPLSVGGVRSIKTPSVFVSEYMPILLIPLTIAW